MADVWVNAPTMTRNTERCTACEGPLPYTQFLLGEETCDPCPEGAAAAVASATPDGPRIGTAQLIHGRARPRKIVIRDSAWARENIEVVHFLVKIDYLRSQKVPSVLFPLLRLLDEGVTPSDALTKAARAIAGLDAVEVDPEVLIQIETLSGQAQDEEELMELIKSAGLLDKLPQAEEDPIVGYCACCARGVRASEVHEAEEGVEVPAGEAESCDDCVAASKAAEAAGEPAPHTTHPLAWDEHGIADPAALRA